ncbi:CACTA en-spm transposon protein [Cucumis melo var. makuwa]|uniref:CACTA en-spm transposon protein n=1 Tax=Cucumis melo var. makuwa TaxID=1194695 RepID=A0A5D3BA90_CUCMM|nr:CACTA en-spm transposon protein [Cucumis melo var. makuwa]TYJ95874.1 CACTA en-spm transposon protein [Cucumis melo var. makuwa]
MFEVKDVENEQPNILKIVVRHCVDEHIEDDTLCRLDIDPAVVERPVMLDEPQPFPSLRRHQQSRNLELERYVHKHGKIPITSTLGVEKPISSHVVRFRNTIDLCVKDTFPVHCLKWSSALYRFVEHQVLTSFKEFRGDCHRHFKKYNDLEQEKLRIDKTTRQKQPYNHSSGSKSFVQRQHELVEHRGQPIDYMKLFRETYARSSQFVSQAVADALIIPAHPRGFLTTLRGRDMRDRFREVEEAKVLIEQQRIKLEEAKRLIEEQRSTLELHAQQMQQNVQQMEKMKKMIEERSRA